jgi:hypothetical protein
MANKQNAPREQGAPQMADQATSQVTRQFDPDQCGPQCGSCWEVFCGDEPCCVTEYRSALKRELRETLAGGGDRA